MLPQIAKLSFAKTVFLLCACGALIFAGCCPIINSFHPETGNIGDPVTIRGKRFEDTAADNTVKFGGVTVPTADIISASTTKIEAKVPPGARTGLISVRNKHCSGESDKNFVVETPTKWTFMVYIDGDNNLEPDAIVDFMEMASVGSSDEVKIVVQMDRRSGYDSSYGNWEDTKRFLIQRDDDPSSDPVEDLGEQNMGDPAVLQDFVEWAITNYPAEHYALSIWNHGGGWRLYMQRLGERARAMKSRGEADTGVTRAVVWDDTDDDVLYMDEVQHALKGAKREIKNRTGTDMKLDVVGFDACLMGMIEVAYEIRDEANYMVGSEYSEPLNGWPYDTILADLVADPALNSTGLAELIVIKYDDSYPPNENVTQAAVDTSKAWDVAMKIDDFTGVAQHEWDDLGAARADTIVYHTWGCGPYCWGVDLWNFADEVYNRASSNEIKTGAHELKNMIDDFVIMERHHGPAMDGSHGVAIYFPETQTVFDNDPDSSGYDDDNDFMIVDFVQVHNWDEWLQDYYSVIP